MIGRAGSDYEVAPWYLFFGSHQLADRSDCTDDGRTRRVQCKHFGEHHIGTSFHRPARYGDAVTAFATAASALVMAFTASSTS
jgi:hypothetical protein